MRALILGTALAAMATPAFAEFILSSTNVKAGTPMAMAQVFDGYGCTGQNISPALSWSGEPAGTKSFAITMYDPDAPTGSGWWHWTVFNIPASVHSLAANAGAAGGASLPPGAGQGKSDFGFSNYGGPCPPPGPAHHYVVTVYALKVPTLPLDADSSGAKVGFNLHFNALGDAKITGTFGTK